MMPLWRHHEYCDAIVASIEVTPFSCYLARMDDDDRMTRISLRMPRDLHAALTGAARARSHSMNAEIVHRLQESLAAPPSLDFPPGEEGRRAIAAWLDNFANEIGAGEPDGLSRKQAFDVIHFMLNAARRAADRSTMSASDTRFRNRLVHFGIGALDPQEPDEPKAKDTKPSTKRDLDLDHE